MNTPIRLALRTLLRPREADEATIQRVIANVKSPRWSAHVLRAKLATDAQPFLDNLTSYPPWLVEYFAHKLVNFGTVAAL